MTSVLRDTASRATAPSFPTTSFPLVTPLGQFLNYASRGHLLPYQEQRPHFHLPERYNHDEAYLSAYRARSAVRSEWQHVADERARKPIRVAPVWGSVARKVEKQQTAREALNASELTLIGNAGRTGTVGKISSGVGSESVLVLGQEDEDPLLVDWYSDNDPDNPLNWPLWRRWLIVLNICLLTFIIDNASPVLSPGVKLIMSEFHVGHVTATLGTTLYILGLGFGPLVLSPVSEIPAIGRNKPYIITLALFTLLQIPTALVQNYAGLLVLRFLAGFAASPALATGGSSISDVFPARERPYAFAFWLIFAATCPSLTPTVAGFLIEGKGWRWGIWEMAWFGAFGVFFLSFTMPETSTPNILYRRAQRLRAVTQNKDLKSQGEIEQSEMTISQLASQTLIRPLQMTFTEPIVIAINAYMSFSNALLYSWFESFPLVYEDMYGFSLGVGGLPYLAIFVGSIIAYLGYIVWVRTSWQPRYDRSNGTLAPEHHFPPAMVGAFGYTICLFLFAWSSGRTHWIVPVIASSFFGWGSTLLFISTLSYFPQAYGKWSASALASADFERQMFTAIMPLVSIPFFNNLGVDWAGTLLGCISVVLLPIPFVIYKYGDKLRQRSKMTE